MTATSVMSLDSVYLIFGAALLVAAALPMVVRGRALSAPLILVVVGMGLGFLPMPAGLSFHPSDHLGVIEHLTELTVITSLMGVGLSLDRRLGFRHREGWRAWSATWRLLAIAMPLAIVTVTGLGWAVMGLPLAAAMLLGSVMAPTDPVLAADVQVEGPTATDEDEDPDNDEHLDEEDEVRFALSSEGGLNDGLAFPFVYAAIYLATKGAPGDWLARWALWEVLGKTVIGLVVGAATGWLVAKLTFNTPLKGSRLVDEGQPLIAIAATFLAYGLGEAAGGWGFLSVFAAALAIRGSERGHEFHQKMHRFIERLEYLLTLAVVLVLGIGLTNGLLSDLSWAGAAVAVLLVLVVRPASGLISLLGGTPKAGPGRLTWRERFTTSFLGVRGLGSLYYLAYATRRAPFAQVDALWSTAGFAIVVSIVLHGITASPLMGWVDREDRAGAAPSERDPEGAPDPEAEPKPVR